MRRRKRLVQVHVDHVEAHVARPHLAQNGVEIRAVVVQQTARIADDVVDLDDVALEHAQRRRIRQHDARRLLADLGLERFDIDIAVRAGRDFLGDAAQHRRRGRVGAVRRIRHDDFIALMVFARLVIRHYHREAGELSLGARHRRERDTLHAGDLLEHLLQLVHAGQETLAVACGAQRVASCKTGPANCRHAGCISSCRSRADRTACRWRNSSATGA